MPRIFIEDLKGGERLEQVFVLRRCDLLNTRSDKLYLAMELGDRTGTIPARKWDANEDTFEKVRDADLVMVQGVVEIYKNQFQIVVNQLRRVEVADIDISEFLPHTGRDIDGMMKHLSETAASLRNPHLKRLLEECLQDDEIISGFRRCPGAVTYHHAFIGGLLEHTVSMLETAEKILPCYPFLDGDLLLAGVILHDVGKIRELNSGTKFSYTDQGQLVGHITLGVVMLDEKVKNVKEFPPDLLMRLRHLILSHHGEHEFGSPVLPMMIESIALHHLDNLDAKLHAFASAVETDAESESNWTVWNKMFKRKLYRG